MNTNTEQNKPTHLRGVKSETSIPTLIRKLVHDGSDLISKEIELAKTEVRENVASLKKGIMSGAAGAFVLHTGILTLVASAVIGLSLLMDAWLAALIIGSVFTLVGFAMIGSAKKKMDAEAMAPNKAIDSVKNDEKAIKEAL